MVTVSIETPQQPGAHVTLSISAEQQVGSEIQQQLDAACRELERDSDGRVLVLRLWGGGRSHVTGPYRLGASVHDVNRWEKTLRRVECVPAPIVGVLEGDCTGFAFDISLVCDMRIGSVDVKVGCVALDDGGLPGFAALRLARQLGAAHARRFALLGAFANADQAQALGLIDIVSNDVGSELGAALRRLENVDGRGWAVWRRMLTDESGKEFDEAFGPALAASDRTLRRRLDASQRRVIAPGSAGGRGAGRMKRSPASSTPTDAGARDR